IWVVAGLEGVAVPLGGDGVLPLKNPFERSDGFVFLIVKLNFLTQIKQGFLIYEFLLWFCRFAQCRQVNFV
ncbi:MAG: hypothetical protein RRY34_05630, partial [Victivallaceae bacterium]